MASKAVSFKAMVVVMVVVIGRPMVGPIPWMPISNRGIQLVSLKVIKQGHLVTMSIGLRLRQKINSETTPFKV